MSQHPFHCGCDDEVCVAQRNATEFDLYAEDEVIFFKFLAGLTVFAPRYCEWREGFTIRDQELATPLEQEESNVR